MIRTLVFAMTPARGHLAANFGSSACAMTPPRPPGSYHSDQWSVVSDQWSSGTLIRRRWTLMLS